MRTPSSPTRLRTSRMHESARIGLTPVRAFFVQPKQRSRRPKSDSENFLKFTGLMM